MKKVLLEKVLRKYEHQKKLIQELQAVHDELKVAEADLASARSRILSLTAQAQAIGTKYAAGPDPKENMQINARKQSSI
jgi:hypothetical protein